MALALGWWKCTIAGFSAVSPRFGFTTLVDEGNAVSQLNTVCHLLLKDGLWRWLDLED